MSDENNKKQDSSKKELNIDKSRNYSGTFGESINEQNQIKKAAEITPKPLPNQSQTNTSNNNEGK